MPRATVWILVAVMLAVLQPSAVWSQNKPQAGPPASAGQSPAPAERSSYRIYSLGSVIKDPEFCNWLAETIPMAVQPHTWKLAGGSGTLSYHVGTKTLVVHQTNEVHSQVDAYLENMKKTVTQEPAALPASVKAQQPGVIHAQYTTPQTTQAGDGASGTSYLVPAPAKQPKHLFHFILRFEGDGTADMNAQESGKGDGAGDAVVAQAQNAISKAIQDGDVSPFKSIPGITKAKNLFHCIIRYEGEGIIDSNVVELFKAYAAAMDDKDPKPSPTAPVPPDAPKSENKDTEKKGAEPRPAAPNAPAPPVDAPDGLRASEAPPFILPTPKRDAGANGRQG